MYLTYFSQLNPEKKQNFLIQNVLFVNTLIVIFIHIFICRN